MINTYNLLYKIKKIKIKHKIVKALKIDLSHVKMKINLIFNGNSDEGKDIDVIPESCKGKERADKLPTHPRGAKEVKVSSPHPSPSSDPLPLHISVFLPKLKLPKNNPPANILKL